MKTTTLLSLTLMMTVFSCTTPVSNHPEKWTDKELEDWFVKGEWKLGWAVTPDESVNKREFALQYFKNRERWGKAFTYLQTTELGTIAPGRYNIQGDSLFVNVNEYVTKNEEEIRYEAHRKYADIQYLVSGEEKIGVIPVDQGSETTPYDSLKDILFMTAGQKNYRTATPDNFFIFFPEDAHRPTIKMADTMKVRKIVVKVLIN